jgi:hypothetical protein
MEVTNTFPDTFWQAGFNWFAGICAVRVRVIEAPRLSRTMAL